jgi:hypothetical protein
MKTVDISVTEPIRRIKMIDNMLDQIVKLLDQPQSADRDQLIMVLDNQINFTKTLLARSL